MLLRNRPKICTPSLRGCNKLRSTLTLQSLLFWKKQGFSPKKARVFLFAEPLKSLEKRGKTHKKARKIGKRKKQGNRKKQGLEGQGKGCLAHRNRSDFCDLRLRCPSRIPEIAAISETRESNAALRFKGAMESR